MSRSSLGNVTVPGRVHEIKATVELQAIGRARDCHGVSGEALAPRGQLLGNCTSCGLRRAARTGFGLAAWITRSSLSMAMVGGSASGRPIGSYGDGRLVDPEPRVAAALRSSLVRPSVDRRAVFIPRQAEQHEQAERICGDQSFVAGFERF
jgi:hypothetical protein